MAAITTTASGAWSATGTWTGGTIPGNGDTVTLNHAVTLSDARTVGVSPAAGAGTNAIRCNSVLTIASGGVLTCRGDIGLNNVGFTIEAGGILEFDASQAGTPSTARYVCKGINASDQNAIVTITGTSTNHAIVRSNSGGANGRFDSNGNARSGMINATFCDFLRIGDSANTAFDHILDVGDELKLVDCTMDACGTIGDYNTSFGDAQSKFTLTRVRMINSPGNSVGVSLNSPTGAGVRSITFCDFDKTCLFYGGDKISFSDVIFRGAYDFLPGNVPVLFERIVLAMATTAQDWFALGTVKDCYVVRLGAPTNPHYFTTGNDTVRITGCIFDCPDGTGPQQDGDCITFNAPSSTQTITVDHNIALHVNNQNVGTMLSCLGGANLTVIAEHNTYHGGQGIYLGEIYSGHAGMVSSLKSNLAFTKTGTCYIVSSDVGIVQNVVASANVARNGVWNPLGTGYIANLSFSSGTPGAGDVSGNPQFVDVDRNIKTWDTAMGGPGTIVNALNQIGLGKRTVQELLDYIREGFTPKNQAFKYAHDAVAPSKSWIGAVSGNFYLTTRIGG